MATVLKQLPRNQAGRPAAPYDWERWTDGRVWEVKRGQDFECQRESMAMALYQHAHRAGVKVAVRRLDADTLAFQFSKPTRKGSR